MKKVRIGTRASRLAIVQAEIVARAIAAYDPGIQTELVPMKTTGDRILHQTLDKIGGKGLFVKELDQALIEERVDIAVHSCKDLPVTLDARLPIVAVSRREDPRDALVLPVNASNDDRIRSIGCSSARRRVQLYRLYPEASIDSVRGNVLTRLQKLDDGKYDALVLAAAGLKRLELQQRIYRKFSIEDILPAAGQGVLAVQARRGENTEWLRDFHSPSIWRCVLAERAFIRALDGGCSQPCAAFAITEKDELLLRGMYVGEDESILCYNRVRMEGGIADHEIEMQAKMLAERMKNDARNESGSGGGGAG